MTSLASTALISTPGATALAKGGYNSKLDMMPFEKLQAMIIKNQDEKLALIEQKEALQEEDDLMGEDPEMIDLKLQLLTKRLKELKAALAARSGGTPSARQTPPPASSSTSTLASDPPQRAVYPTPDTVGPSRPLLQLLGSNERLPVSSTSSDESPKQILRPLPMVPKAAMPASTNRTPHVPKRAQKLAPTPPPEVDDIDIAMAEEMDRLEDPLIPPSSPPAAAITTPSRARPTKGALARRAAIAELENVPPGVPPSPIRPPSAKTKRSQGYAAKSMRANAVAGPSTQRAVPEVQEPRAVQIEVRYPWSKEVEEKMKTYFKIPKFRYHQKEAIDETMAGKDVFVLMPTGGGKSLTYQLPAICQGGKTRGITFVISPLISLINDQTRHLCKLGIPAIAYTGELTQKDKDAAHQQMDTPEPWTRVVYVTPEMMSMGGYIKGIMRRLVERKRLARFVVDEAHCVSQWGHDFREDYLKLDNLRKEYPSVPIMALTATAQDKVQDDIIRQLGIRGCAVLKQSFNRPNLHYEIRPKDKKVLDDMVAFINIQKPGSSGIIYCSSRDKCEDIAKALREQHGLGAYHYHAGMTKGDRRKIQEGWQEHKFEIIVATIAFGMGIDKPDVRYVLHHSIPRSLEGYYQETGRAGRDGNHSTCILYYAFGDYQGTVKLIENDRDTSWETKARQKAAVDEVLRFCSNKTDCRRTQILSFFNERFEAADCHRTCDTCLTREQNLYQEEDVTADAKIVLLMMEAFDEREKITTNNLVNCFRGKNGGVGKNLNNNPYFGRGKDWAKGEADRLIQLLMIEGALAEYYVANAAGWNNSYLKLGKTARLVLADKKPLALSFKVVVVANKTAKTGKPRTAKGQQGIGMFTKRVSNPISRKRSAQQILAEEEEFDNSGWGDTDEEAIIDDDSSYGGGERDDPIELDNTDVEEDDVPLAKAAAVKKRKVQASTSKPASAAKSGPRVPWSDAKGKERDVGRNGVDAATIDIERQDSQSPVDRCFRELRAVVDRARGRDKKLPPVRDEDLQMVAAIMPQNEVAMKRIEGLTPKLIATYGRLWLDKTIKYKAFVSHADGAGGKNALRTTARMTGTSEKIESRGKQLDLNLFAYPAGKSTSTVTVAGSSMRRSSSGTALTFRRTPANKPLF